MFTQAFGAVFGTVFGLGMAVIALICVMEIIDWLEKQLKKMGRK